MLRITLMTLAILLVTFGIAGLFMMPRVIQENIQKRLQLKIATKMYDRFTKVPIPITVRIRFFNITNPDEVLAGLAGPKFQEVGPFIYRQHRRRDVQDFEDYNRKVRYREIKTYYLDEAANRLDLNKTMITLVNVPILAVLTKVSQVNGKLGKTIASKIVSRLSNDGGEQILITRPATEFLFDGYNVRLFQQAQKMVDGFGFPFDSPLKRNKFGFFYGKNGTWNKKENGEYVIFSGRNDSFDKYFQVDTWNDLKKLDVWPGASCNVIKGGDGSQFHPGVTRDSHLHVFSPEVCRSLYLEYREDTSAKGIPLYRFVTPREVMSAPRKNPKNACYCAAGVNPKNVDNGAGTMPSNGPMSGNDNRCYLDGIMDLSLCQGAPIAVSSPHFYGADPMLSMTAGLRPQQAIHETYVDIEPMTGSPMRASKRAQINAIVDESALKLIDSSIIGNMTPMIAPLFWIEESAEIDEKSAREFKSQLLEMVQSINKTFYTLILVGVIIILVISAHFIWVVCIRARESNDNQMKSVDQKNRKSGYPRRRSRRPINTKAAEVSLDQKLIHDNSSLDVSSSSVTPVSASSLSPSTSGALGDLSRMSSPGDDEHQALVEVSRQTDKSDDDETDPARKFNNNMRIRRSSQDPAPHNRN